VPRFRLRSVLTVLVTVGIFYLAASVLQRQLAGVQWVDVRVHLQEIQWLTVAAALACCGLAYAALAWHEVLAVRESTGAALEVAAEPVTGGAARSKAATPMPGCSARRAIVTALVAYPIGHAVGVGALSGGAVRLRWYTAAGLSLAEVGQVVLLCTIPYAVGLGVLFSVSLLWRGEIAAGLLHVPVSWTMGLAAFFLLFHVAYVTATFRVRGRWQWPRWLGGLSLKLPSGRLTRAQYLLGIIDVGAAAGILYLFLPAGVGMSYVAFLPLYVLCIFAALASNVPAGLGVFESVLLVLLPHVPPSQLLGAMVLYRGVYELVPLACAVLALAAAEIAGRGRSPRRSA
jgi:uncharacterized membrane protein YbhN (UPF0104 family)